MRLEAKRVDLSSNERTMAPSALLLINSNKPGNPETETILLYSILLFFMGLQDKPNLENGSAVYFDDEFNNQATWGC
jgi:hypothetical protein